MGDENRRNCAFLSGQDTRVQQLTRQPGDANGKRLARFKLMGKKLRIAQFLDS